MDIFFSTWKSISETFPFYFHRTLHYFPRAEYIPLILTQNFIFFFFIISYFSVSFIYLFWWLLTRFFFSFLIFISFHSETFLRFHSSSNTRDVFLLLLAFKPLKRNPGYWEGREYLSNNHMLWILKPETTALQNIDHRHSIQSELNRNRLFMFHHINTYLYKYMQNKNS